MQKPNKKSEQNLASTNPELPLFIACEQTCRQRVEMKMDELFNSSPQVPIYSEPVAFENNETLVLKKKSNQPSRKRRLSTNSAAGRNRRLESEQEQVKLERTTQRNKPETKLGLFTTTLKLALVAVMASFCRA